MDLRLLTALPTDAERDAVDTVLGPPAGGWDGGERTAADGRVALGGRAAREQRHLLLPALHALQENIGWISQGGLAYASERLTVPPAEAYGVASFYALFSMDPTPPVVIHACDDVACAPYGADDLRRALAAEYGEQSAAVGEVTWKRSPCLGLCEQAPAVLVQATGRPMVSFGPATIDAVRRVAAGSPVAEQTPPPIVVLGESVLTERIAGGSAISLDGYLESGGYGGLASAVDRGPAGVIDVLEGVALRGRGGAAFPAAVKWRAVAAAADATRYVVCNADESEPGTFKDRVLLEWDPFSVLEGMTVAAYATGATRGFIYLRGEYALATARLTAAIDEATSAGYLGADVTGAGFTFDVEIRRGAGAYICGEETALFNSIEGYRGEPRSKPPFPTENGLFGRPTVINNVETLSAVTALLAGCEDAGEAKLFCVSGTVERPGLYEAPLGTSVAALVAAAGATDVDAVLVGGAAGRFLGSDDLDAPLDYSPEGPPIGSGAVVVFDETVDMDGTVLRIAEFFRDESCGQCVPCRVGTVRLEEALHRMVDGSATEGPLISDVAAVMRDASICGLGQTATGAIESALELGLIGSGDRRG